MAAVDALEDRHKMELQIARNLWRQCFHDPEAYEEFYFDNVYPNNRVYLEEDKGMLHLNPYLCHVGMQERILHYIVGVATDERYRRRGIMRNLLQRALLDMREEQEPFTYLMPADVRYYEPFGFVSAKEEERCEIGIAQLSAAQVMPYSFCTFETLIRNLDGRRLAQIFGTLDHAIQQRYRVAPVHDELYFRMLYKEKACQHGNIVFVLNEEQNAMGYFAYAMDDEYPRIEQSFWMEEDQTEWAVRRYFGKKAGWWKSFPYMMRVVDVTAFLQLFSKQCQRLSDGYEGLRIEDSVLPENTGCYRADNGWEKITEFLPETMQERYRTISVGQIAEELFGKNGQLRDKIWFAEIV